MREFKFRAYDKFAEKLMDEEDIGILPSNDTIGTTSYGNVTLINASNEHYVIMQNTGMKDQNGIEIYEDDNLKIVLDSGTYISPVMKRHGCWVIYHPYRLDIHTGERDYIIFGWWTSHDNVEVIGNIHEQEPHA